MPDQLIIVGHFVAEIVIGLAQIIARQFCESDNHDKNHDDNQGVFHGGPALIVLK